MHAVRTYSDSTVYRRTCCQCVVTWMCTCVATRRHVHPSCRCALCIVGFTITSFAVFACESFCIVLFRRVFFSYLSTSCNRPSLRFVSPLIGVSELISLCAKGVFSLCDYECVYMECIRCVSVEHVLFLN